MTSTRNGVYYDLSKSEYKYKSKNVTYVFSSLLHLKKFKRKLKEHRIMLNESLSNRFKINIDVGELSEIVLYMKVETRGFLILGNEDLKEWEKSNIILDGVKVTKTN